MCRLHGTGIFALVVVVSLAGAQHAPAQVTLDPAWPENPLTFGGQKDDRADSVQQTTDGGYIVAGRTESFGAGGWDVYVFKLDAQGQLDRAWNPNPKTFGGDGGDWAYSVQQTADGGYIVAGSTWPSDAGEGDVYLIKLDSGGNLDPAWDPNPKSFDNKYADYANSVQQTTDGGYILAGSTRSFDGGGEGVYLIKLDGLGSLDPAWDPNPGIFESDGSQYATSVRQTQDGGYVVAGGSLSFGFEEDVYLIKLDNGGHFDPAWDPNPKMFGGEGIDYATSVQQTADGGYIVAGSTWSSDARDGDVYLIKLDAQGNLDSAWAPNPKTFGGEDDDVARSVQQTSDGGYIVAGHTESFGAGRQDVYLLKLDSAGNLDPAWDPNARTFGGEGLDSAYSVMQTTDRGYIVAGWTRPFGAGERSDVLLLKFAPARHFLRGDCDGGGTFSGITDAVFLLEYLFRSGTRPACLAACDANGDGSTGGVTDAVYILQHAFFGTEPPPEPYPECGAGQLWTDGPLTCETEPPCP